MPLLQSERSKLLKVITQLKYFLRIQSAFKTPHLNYSEKEKPITGSNTFNYGYKLEPNNIN